MNAKPPPLAHRNLPQLLLQARERVLGRFRPILNAHGLTEQQWRVVRVLYELGPLEPREIGELCQISSPSLAGVLSRMDDLGLVSRKRLEYDQRRLLVSLKPKSRVLATRMAPLIEANYARIEQELGKAFLERLQQTIDELLERLPANAATSGAEHSAD